MRSTSPRLVGVFLAVVLLAGAAGAAQQPSSRRPASSSAASASTSATASTSQPASQPTSHPAWAEPVSVEGVPNVFKVCPGLYRGGQPKDAGYENLRRLGIKTVVSLRSNHGEADHVARAGMAFRAIPMNAWHAEDEDVVAFLKIVSDPANLPVFVHCQHGSDRTGMLIAIYRIFLCSWSKQEAIEEMTLGESGFHYGFQNLPDYLRKLNVQKIRKQVGS